MKISAKKILMALAIAMATTTGAMAMSYGEAAKQDKPIVIMFKSQMCGACKEMSPIFDKIGAKFADKFNFVKEDASSSIASSYKFDTVPSIFITKPNSKSSTKISYECATNDACFQKTLKDYK